MSSKPRSKRVIFTQGGKGGVGKTEVALALASWLHERGIKPLLLDFDIENTNKSGLQNFYPEAQKIDLHRDGNLDEFYQVCETPNVDVILADMGAGGGAATYRWFDDAFDLAQELNMQFTAVGVTVNDAGSVQSILKWASHLGEQVNYLVVLNEMHVPRCEFEYWHDTPEVKAFVKALHPKVMTMAARVEEFQAELRNQALTLERVIRGQVESDFFRYIKNLVRAKKYQRQLFEGFDEAASILTTGQKNHAEEVTP